MWTLKVTTTLTVIHLFAKSYKAKAPVPLRSRTTPDPIRDGPGDGPCWLRGGPCWSWMVREVPGDSVLVRESKKCFLAGQKLPGWSGTVREDRLVRGGPCLLRVGSGDIRSGSGVVLDGPY